MRVELEWIDGAKVKREGKVPVVHNYGYVDLRVLMFWCHEIAFTMDRHDGFGFQSSWGCALKVLEILDEALDTGVLNNSVQSDLLK